MWAKIKLDTTLKFDWFQGFKETYWEILSEYHQQIGTVFTFDTFFETEKEINDYLSTYLKEFFRSHDQVKSLVIKDQWSTIHELATPVISLTDKMAILPIMGTIDTNRAKIIQEEALNKVNEMKISKMVIDLSGVTYIDTFVTKHLFTIIGGLNLLGCETILTGINPEIASSMVDLKISLPHNVIIKSSLKEALKEES